MSVKSSCVARANGGPSGPVRIACVGNMNNNNFALMRYLRDLGADAHLFLHSNEINHFLPEHDTWAPERWQPYIHTLDVGNNPRHLLWHWRRFAKHLTDFDFVIGSGIVPALCSRAGLRLDLFYPYSPGIEYYQAVWMTGMLNQANWAKRLFYRFVCYHQGRGIRQSRHRTNLDFGGETDRSFHALRCAYHPISIPMVYPEEPPDHLTRPAWLKDLIEYRRGRRLTILSHSRQHWVRDAGYSAAEWRLATKHNDYLLRGFAAYLRQHVADRPLLLLCEYGKDVAATKALVEEMDIGLYVRWVPRCSRREIMELLHSVDVCVAEFMEEGIWGGTTWEALAAGRPVIQSVNFTPEDYRSRAGHELPPVLAARSVEEVEQHLLRLASEPGAVQAIGAAGRDWFRRNNGRNLAKRYLDILQQKDES